MGHAGSPFARLLEVFDRMKIAYAVGGSVASSAHGVPRTTLDIDLVVNLRLDQVDEFVGALQHDFYADADLIRDALQRGRASNLIHFKTGFKFDLFPLGQDPYSLTGFGRRSFRNVQPDSGEAIECAVASAEDIVLRKLEWYRAGGESSERQWNDVRGVCNAVSGTLDLAYLRRWAPDLKVEDLLEKLLAEFGW